MQKKVNIIENHCPKPERQSVLIPIAGILIFGFLLYWSYNHISGGCTDFFDLFSYCSVIITK